MRLYTFVCVPERVVVAAAVPALALVTVVVLAEAAANEVDADLIAS